MCQENYIDNVFTNITTCAGHHHYACQALAQHVLIISSNPTKHSLIYNNLLQ